MSDISDRIKELEADCAVMRELLEATRHFGILRVEENRNWLEQREKTLSIKRLRWRWRSL